MDKVIIQILSSVCQTVLSYLLFTSISSYTGNNNEIVLKFKLNTTKPNQVETKYKKNKSSWN